MKRLFLLRINKSILYFFFIGLILITGVFVRIQAFRQAHSLWIDEACLMLNVLERPFSGLLEPLADDQGAPVGFLFAVKGLVNIFGESEPVLRLIPFLGSLASLVLFYFLSRKLLNRSGMLIALIFFSFHPGLIRYTAEAKQYSTDVTISLALLLSGYLFIGGRKTWTQVIGISVLGAAAIWFSHPAIFILATLGAIWFVDLIRSRKTQDRAKMILVGIAWLSSFGLFYLVSLSKLRGNDFLMSFWSIGFPPFPIHSWQDFYWYVNLPASLFNYPTDNPYWGLAGFFVIFGSIFWLKEKTRDPFLVLTPILITLFAAVTRLYPFASRLILFLVPCGILLMVKGIEQTAALFQKGRIAYLACILFLLGVYPLSDAFDRDLRQDAHEELRPVVAFLKNEQKPGDEVYVYYASTCSFRYYARQYHIPPEGYRIGAPLSDVTTHNWKNLFADDIQAFASNPRVWFVFSHDRAENLSQSLEFLNLKGKQLEVYIKPDASVYLYDLQNWDGRNEAP